MKIKMKALLTVCTLILVFVAGDIVGATGVVQNIQANLVSDFKFKMDGNEVTPRDANGNVVLPIVYEGKTYLPVRAFGNLFNYRIDWLPESKTVVLMNPNYVPIAEDQAIPEVELNDSQASANLMPLNAKMKGELRAKNELTGDWDRQDYYKIVLPKDGTLNLKLNYEKQANCYLRIYEDGESDPLKSGKQADQEANLSLQLKAGTYFVCAGTAYTSKTTYTLENTFN